MFDLLYGSKQNDELRKCAGCSSARSEALEAVVGTEDRRLIDEHVQMVQGMEKEIEARRSSSNLGHPVPTIDRSIEDTNNNIPQIAKMQIDLMFLHSWRISIALRRCSSRILWGRSHALAWYRRKPP